MHFSHHKKTSANAAEEETTSATTVSGGAGRIAYVDIDTLESHYTYLKTKKDELQKRQDAMEGELQRSFQQMQSDIDQIKRKGEANTLTQAEYEAAQKRIGQMQQSLETRKQALTEELMKEQDDFNKDLKTRLDNFLADYNKDKKFDYILSYGANGSILFANKALNITQDVINGMNKLSQNTDDKAKNK